MRRRPVKSSPTLKYCKGKTYLEDYAERVSMKDAPLKSQDGENVNSDIRLALRHGVPLPYVMQPRTKQLFQERITESDPPKLH